MRALRFATLLSLSSLSIAQVYLNSEDFTLKGASSACNASLNAALPSCPYEVGLEPESQRFESTVLTSLCATACATALANMRSSVSSACGTWQYIDSYGTVAYPATALIDYYVWSRSLACLQNTARAYCALATNDTTITGSCSECMLKSEQVYLNSPFGYSDSQATDFASIKASCSVTSWPVTKPTAIANATTTSASSSATTCTGTTISVAGASCTDLSANNRISTPSLLQANRLNGGCVNFPSSGTLCLPDNMRCNVYRVQPNDTCISVSAKIREGGNNVTTVQFQAWNWFVDSLCANFDNGEFVGQDVCTSNPLGYVAPATNPSATQPQITSASTAMPVPTDVAPDVNAKCGRYYLVAPGDNCNLVIQRFAISLEDFLFLNPQINSNCTNLWANYEYCILPVGDITTYSGHPLSTATVTFTGNGGAFTWSALPTITGSPNATTFVLADGSRKDCVTYFGPNNGTIACSSVASYYGVTTSDLLQWNPSLSNGTGCVLEKGINYCVSLSGFSYDNSTSTTTFNPLSAPGAVQTGVITPCYQWYKNEVTCQQLLNANGITFAHFYEWNPAVGSNCENLWKDTYYCVYGPDYDGMDTVPTTGSIVTTFAPTSTSTSTSKTSSTSSTTSSAAIPGPTREGTVSNCNKWALASSTCADLLSQNGITIAQLYAWNPTVLSDCTGMWGGYAYCVGVSGSTSTSSSKTTSTTTSTTSKIASTTATDIVTGTVAPSPNRTGTVSSCKKWRLADDTCANILSQSGITIAQFYSWNPIVSSDCTGMWSGYWYCIAIS